MAELELSPPVARIIAPRLRIGWYDCRDGGGGDGLGFSPATVKHRPEDFCTMVPCFLLSLLLRSAVVKPIVKSDEGPLQESSTAPFLALAPRHSGVFGCTESDGE